VRLPAELAASAFDWPTLLRLAGATDESEIEPILRRKLLLFNAADTLKVLEALKNDRLAAAPRGCIEVWCHNCVPNASAIIIDGDSDEGLFQVETKGHRTGMNKSFGFEVGAGSELFRDLRDSYRQLIDDGRRVF